MPSYLQGLPEGSSIFPWASHVPLSWGDECSSLSIFFTGLGGVPGMPPYLHLSCWRSELSPSCRLLLLKVVQLVSPEQSPSLGQTGL